MIQYIFPVTVALSGLMAGLHFGNVLGYLPALAQVEAEHIAPFWKTVDKYFGRRMPIFGISLLVCMVLSILLLMKYSNSIYFWLMAAGFGLSLVDLFITLRMNTPVNEVLRAWNGGAVPEKFETLRSKAVGAFYGRAAASILSFILIVLAYVQWSPKL